MLPPASEEKRLAVAGAHNTIAILGGAPLLLAMLVGLFVQFRRFKGDPNDVGANLVQLMPVFISVLAGLVLLGFLQSWNDRRLCLKLGFICDRCGARLYPSNAYLTGVCPSCGEKIVDKPLVLNK